MKRNNPPISVTMFFVTCLLLISKNILAQSYTVSTFAGSSTTGFIDGTGIQARFKYPYGVAIDKFGNIYVSDQDNHSIRKITPNAEVSKFAGSGSSGYVDANGISAKFNKPSGIAVDTAGNIYVADKFNHRIRKITPDGTVTTIAGSGVQGFANGVGTDAKFNSPSSVAVDLNGNVYVADEGNLRIRKITPDGTVTSIAGKNPGNNNGNGEAASFRAPTGIALSKDGILYVVDQGFNHNIRKITSDSIVTTLAGNTQGFKDGDGINASFSYPASASVDSEGNIYVADRGNNTIRKITPNGNVTSLTSSSSGYVDGPNSIAKLNTPYGVAVDKNGDLYVADLLNNRIRKFTKESIVTSVNTTFNTDVKTYPIPAFESITIEFSSPSADIVQIQIFDISGKQVAKKDGINIGKGVQKIDINTIELENGTYYLLIRGSNTLSSSNVIIHH